MTRMLTQRPRLDAELEAVVERTRMTAAWNTLGAHDPHRLELTVNDWSGPAVEVSPDFSDACGVAIAAALLEHQGEEWERWAVRLLAWDEEIGAWILLREWRSSG